MKEIIFKILTPFICIICTLLLVSYFSYHFDRNNWYAFAEGLFLLFGGFGSVICFCFLILDGIKDVKNRRKHSFESWWKW